MGQVSARLAERMADVPSDIKWRGIGLRLQKIVDDGDDDDCWEYSSESWEVLYWVKPGYWSATLWTMPNPESYRGETPEEALELCLLKEREIAEEGEKLATQALMDLIEEHGWVQKSQHQLSRVRK